MIDLYRYKDNDGVQWLKITQQHLEEYTYEVANLAIKGDITSIAKMLVIRTTELDNAPRT